MKIYYKYVNPPEYVENPLNVLDCEIKEIENTLKVDFEVEYARMLKNVNYPIDGIIYCPEDWKYPDAKEKFDKKDYGKHAWKPSIFNYSKVEKIEWPITKNGELNPIVYFNQIKFGGKVYTHCKITVTQLIEYINKGFGINSEINIVVTNSITAHIENVISKGDKVYKIPTKCPYCGLKLVLENGKTTGKGTNKEIVKHLMCKNENCIGRKIQLYTYLLSNLSKLNKNFQSGY